MDILTATLPEFILAIFLVVIYEIELRKQQNKVKLQNKVHFYVTRDKDTLSKGTLNLWINKPSRGITMWIDAEERWTRHIAVERDFEDVGLNKNDFDNLKWEDEPVEVFLNLEN